MDEPVRKKRRTNSPEESGRQSSPLRKSPRRPSFASPTKSSLARNYPNLLGTTGSPTPKPNSRSNILARGKEARAFVLGETTQNPVEEDSSRGTTTAADLLRSNARNTTPRAKTSHGQKRGLRPRSTPDEKEPELPATPSQQGLEEQDGPRRGILFSSPSKRPPRRKDPVKQSPLKPRAPPVQEHDLTTTVVEDGPTNDDDYTQDVAGKKQLLDPEIEWRKQDKARLEREIADLEAQVSKCTEEIGKEQQRTFEQSLHPSERSDLITFLTKITGAGADAEEEQPTPVSSLLCSFLPFSAISIPRPRTNQPEKPIASHQPIELADPLPYLEMFTSFKFSTQLNLPRGKVFSASNRVHQKHTIDIVGPQKLLTAQVSIHVDTLANKVIDLHILRLSAWAERELGTYIRKKAEEKDLGNACWAIDSYWEIAQKRAHYWHKCEKAFSHLIVGSADEDTENARPEAKTASISRRDLNRHLGRDMIILQDKHVLLKLNWQIGFDWTGEAESVITVEPAFPQVCKLSSKSKSSHSQH